MFFGNSRQITQLEGDLRLAHEREAALGAELDALRQTCREHEQASRQKEQECDVLRATLRNLALFSQSLSSSQVSLGEMANLLKEEKQQAVEAADVSTSSGQTTTEIAANLHRLAEDSARAARDVEVLAEQATQINRPRRSAPSSS